MKLELDDYVADFFQRDPDVFDWRIYRISGKVPESKWQDDYSSIMRNVFKEIQYLLWQREFAEWTVSAIKGIVNSDKWDKLPAHKQYTFICEYHRSSQMYKYLNAGLHKIAEEIDRDYKLNTPELQAVKVDYEGHPYIELIPFDMYEILGKTLDKEDQSPE
jgi:hypothetical protein